MKKKASHNKLLTYAEQLCLLTIDPVTGRFYPVSGQVWQLTLAGALLFDASFNGLINDDWKMLSVLATADTGDAAMDETLRCLQVVDGPVSLDHALTLVATHASTLERLVWDSMESHGLITLRQNQLSFTSGRDEQFTPDLALLVGIHKKIRAAILHDGIPDMQIPALVSLMVAGGLTIYILKPAETKLSGERLTWLSEIESLGREIIRSVKTLATADIERDAAAFIGIDYDSPKSYAGGMDSVLSSLSYLIKETGLRRSRKIIANLNQKGGFECPGCAWPNPDKFRSHFEFCESGAKNLSSEATLKLLNAGFFEKWAVHDLLMTSEYWLEQQGRLTEPMILEEHATHYRPISWDDAFRIIAKELKSLSHPDEAVFYASGRTSNEAAFLYQLFARTFGTNNLPNSANLCHEPSGKALSKSLGFGKSSVTPIDFTKADAIFLFGHNPGSNHPRMLKSLQAATRNGSRIVAVNPMPEASLLGFADPQEASSWFGKQTSMAHLFLQPVINGDMALVRGIVKAILESEEHSGGILDHNFIDTCTSGFNHYRKMVHETPWDLLVSASGVEKNQMFEAAAIYTSAKRVIASWCLGITHHRNAVETIREIVNLMLLRGNIGKPGAGVCPVRGHSNIQGMRTAGVGENLPAPFLDAIEKQFQITVPRRPGLSVIPAMKSMATGHAKVLVSLGGNLASAIPDTVFAEHALRKCRLTVMISTKLNRSHLVTGQKALILPCLTRSEMDIQNEVEQMITIEDAMGKVGFSMGCLPPASAALRSEVSIIAEMARMTLDPCPAIDWRRFGKDYQFIRSSVARVIPDFCNLDKTDQVKRGFYLRNPLRDRIFNTSDNKAQFSSHPLEMVVPEAGELMLMTIRSHDQFNTAVFGLNDRYRGIVNERRVLFMNRNDMDERHINPGELVDVTSQYDHVERKLEGYYAIAYPIRKGCVAAYFPEANALTSINNTSECDTPAYKSVRVTITHATRSSCSIKSTHKSPVN